MRISAKKFREQKKPRTKSYLAANWVRRAAALAVAAAVFFTLFTSAVLFQSDALARSTPGLYYYEEGAVNHLADGNTTDSYLGALDLAASSRYAGRVWSDKSVFASQGEPGKGELAQIELNMSTDGYNGKVTSDSDFLHVFSALGSNISSDTYTPLDVVFVLDVSNSMKNSPPNDSTQTTRIEYAIDGLNDCIDMLMTQGSPYNRVAVVAYNGNRPGTVSDTGNGVVLLNLGQYNKGTGTGASTPRYFGVDIDTTTGTGLLATGTVYTVATETGQGSKGAASVAVAGATNTQIAMYKGMDLLVKADPKVDYDGDGAMETRQPIVVLLSDGQPTVTSGPVTETSSGGWFPTYTYRANWWALSESAMSDGAGSFFGNGLLTMATSSYMKERVTEHYGVETIVHTFGVDITGLGADIPAGDPRNEQGNSRASAEADALAAVTLNPGKELEKVAYKRATGSELDSSEPATLIAGQIYDAWQIYINPGTPAITVCGDLNVIYDYRNSAWRGKQSNQVIETVVMPHPPAGVKDITTLDYVTKFHPTSGTDLPAELRQMVQEFLEYAFTPISGMNNIGIADALTYVDPIGEYMEIKDKTIGLNDGVGTDDMYMLLFGNMYGVKKTGVYDYHDQNSSTVTFDYVSSFVPSFDKADATKWQNTVYSLYTLNNVTNVDKWRLNRAYEGNVSGVEAADYDANYIFTDKKQAEFNALAAAGGQVPGGVYRLSDIKIWVEDTDDYEDDNGAEFFAGVGYDQALYVSIPSNALPVQVVDVRADFNNPGVRYYSTNLNDPSISTPIRLFYGVGVADEILTVDKNGFDLTKVSRTYIDSHTEGENNDRVYFLSNYFTGEKEGNHEGQGDPAVTFSPSETNRYYIYQKTLTLYSRAYQVQNNRFALVSEPDDLNYEGTHGEFKGVLSALPSANGYAEGDVIFLQADAVTTAINENAGYFMAIDYFKPGAAAQNGKTLAEPVRFAIGRSGAEFYGDLNAYSSHNIKADDMLCWLNPETGAKEAYSKGKPAGNGWVLATNPGGLRAGSLTQSWVEKGTNGNPTDTADYAYMPTVSKNTRANIHSGDEVIDAKDALIDIYLGNNGRLSVGNTELLVTKRVKDNERVDPHRNQSFTYQVYIQGFTGIRSAIKVRWDNDTKLWYRLIGYIDVPTDNTGLLQDVNLKRARVTAEGIPDDNGQYYAYLGAEANHDGENAVRIYDYDSSNTKVKGHEVKSGTRFNYYADSVVLVPASVVDNAAGDEAWLSQLGGYNRIDLLIAELDISKHGEHSLGSDTALNTFNYYARVHFATVDLYFGVEPNGTTEDDEADFAAPTELYDTNNPFGSYNITEADISANTAEFTLKHGEGLLFIGIASGDKYRLTEKLSEDDEKNGWRLWTKNEPMGAAPRQNTEANVAARHVQQDSIIDYQPDANEAAGAKVTGTDTWGSTDLYSSQAKFDGDKLAYSVSGDTSSKEEAVHYLNEYAPTSLEVSKTVIDKDRADPGDEYKFIIDIEDSSGNKLNGTYHAYIETKAGGYAKAKDHTHGSHCIELIFENGISSVSLSDGQILVITGLPQGAHYIVTEDCVVKGTGYDYEVSGDVTGEIVDGVFSGHSFEGKLAEGDMNKAEDEDDTDVPGVHVAYKNVVKLDEHYGLTVKKVVTGSGDNDADWTFSIKLTPPAGTTLGDLAYTGLGGKDNGTLTLTDNGDGTYTGTVTLKHGQSVTINNLPNGTAYTVTEAKANQDGYVTTVTVIGNGTVTAENDGAAGVIDSADEAVGFVNHLDNILEFPDTGGSGAIPMFAYITLLLAGLAALYCIITNRAANKTRS